MAIYSIYKRFMLKNSKYSYNYYKLPKNTCKWKIFSVLSKQVFILFHKNENVSKDGGSHAEIYR